MLIRTSMGVLEGDQATSSDAERIRATGAAVVQINTGTGCHLDAHMVAHGVARLDLSRGTMLLIENVGNLVCPALFDLGEHVRVVVVSVTEGDDKPLKYPHMCRLCLVEVAGVGRLVPACTTPAQSGMSVTTDSETLAHDRLMALELLFIERNHICAVCVSNGHCDLQSMAQTLGLTHVRFPYNSPRLPVDASHPRWVLDHNRCILCSRCVRVCAEIEGANVWDISARGINSMLVAENDRPWGEAQSCTNCGKCVQVCPTGALVEKGQAVEEMTKRSSIVTQLAAKRGTAP